MKKPGKSGFIQNIYFEKNLLDFVDPSLVTAAFEFGS